jgi:transcriptional regulator with XRE-family HTH domain
MNTEVKNPHLAAIIKEERHRRNLTQMAEVDVRTIQRAERDGSCGAESLMAIADAFNRDAKDLIAEAEERQKQQKNQPRPPKDLVVRLDEATNGHELFAVVRSSHASIQDFDPGIKSQHLRQIGFIFDYLRDFGDIKDDVSSSHLIQFAEEIGAALEALRSNEIFCFVGHYDDRLIVKGKPQDPFDWRAAVVTFRSGNDTRILSEKDGRRFMVVTIPGSSRKPTF